jgi:hypothetical protein
MSEDCIPACTSAALTSDVNLAAHDANRNQTTFFFLTQMKEDSLQRETSRPSSEQAPGHGNKNRGNQTTFYHSPPGPQLAQYSTTVPSSLWRFEEAAGVQLAESCKRMSCTLAMTQVTPHAVLSIDC